MVFLGSSSKVGLFVCLFAAKEARMWCGERVMVGGSEGSSGSVKKMMRSEEKDGVDEGSRGTGRSCVAVVVLKDEHVWDKMCLFL